METLNYEPIAKAICKALANTQFTHTVKQAQELSRGYIATNSLHIEFPAEDLPEDFETDGLSLLMEKTLINALREQGFDNPKVTKLRSFDNLIIEAYKGLDLYATIHLVTWDLEIAITTTQYYL